MMLQLGRAASCVVLLALMVLKPWPGSAGAQTVEDGRKIYERRCSVCHGDKGSGAYWASDSLVPPPRDFTKADREVLTREAMIDAVANGREGTAMTAWRNRLSPGQIASVVDFVRSEFMSALHAVEKPGETLSSKPEPGRCLSGRVEGQCRQRRRLLSCQLRGVSWARRQRARTACGLHGL